MSLQRDFKKSQEIWWFSNFGKLSKPRGVITVKDVREHFIEIGLSGIVHRHCSHPILLEKWVWDCFWHTPSLIVYPAPCDHSSSIANLRFFMFHHSSHVRFPQCDRSESHIICSMCMSELQNTFVTMSWIRINSWSLFNCPIPELCATIRFLSDSQYPIYVPSPSIFRIVLVDNAWLLSHSVVGIGGGCLSAPWLRKTRKQNVEILLC